MPLMRTQRIHPRGLCSVSQSIPECFPYMRPLNMQTTLWCEGQVSDMTPLWRQRCQRQYTDTWGHTALGCGAVTRPSVVEQSWEFRAVSSSRGISLTDTSNTCPCSLPQNALTHYCQCAWGVWRGCFSQSPVTEKPYHR